jgi:hypothetical protein
MMEAYSAFVNNITDAVNVYDQKILTEDNGNN